MRLLVWLAAVICYIPLIIRAWNIPFFSSKQETEQVNLYPGSPLEADPEVIRSRRQAYQVYQGGDTSVTVDKSGHVETGPWGPWTHEQQCSRTCGGGVQIERRICAGECTGPSTRYVSCNIEDCPSGAKDFRAVQCSEHDDSPLDGNYYKWLPYPGKNKCELTCKPDNANFYYKWADKVVDGTKCNHRNDDICVEGICLPVGCDNKLGSAKKYDKCGVCAGDGSTCKTVEGFFDERNLTPGYHNIILLPIGATSIRVEEIRPTTNSLAIKNTSNHYYLNGNYQIQLTDKDLDIGGTLFEYDNRKNLDHPFEKLTARGPTTEELIIALLFQRGNRDSAIKYEFSVPLEKDIPYMYQAGKWSPCSVTCGKGVHTRTPYCIDSVSQQPVADEVCEQNNVTKPSSEKACETVDCEAEWFQGEWEPCSTSCGDMGTQYRVVYCHQVFSDGKRMTVDDVNCTTQRPSVQQSCNRFSCPEWQAGPWSACSEKCGDAHQYRSVTCRSAKEGEEGKLLAAEACGKHDLEAQRSCNLGPCEGLNFFTTEWKLCEKCNDTEETRNVTCKDTTGRAYPLEKCLNDNTTEIPVDTRPCATPQPCIYEWHTSEWSKCSTECGHGHNSRRVVCAIHQLDDLTVVDEGHCNAEVKPESKKNCTNEEKCNGTYYTGPWSKCTADCGGGTQSRMIVCLNYDKKPVPDWCDESEKPPEEQKCNTDPCPTCDESEFGCCPDNVTFASGPYLTGCSNCSMTEFGCCADNVTEAEGPMKEGCPEFVDEPEGSGEDNETTTEEPMEESKEMCEVASDKTGETAMVACKKPENETIEFDAEMLSNVTDQNATKHCSKMEFGCCPDWTTPAEGKNNQGCPEFVLGVCNETTHGCCPDEVTLARGPNYEGCGEPSCAASLYGCCKDRKTIAFGPHYAGCERSSFPCELSTFGCCPDGETAALGKNGTGCGENCLLTKFGCCPDGETSAKGLNNEGCGCEYAQFGCCPDGKTSAIGLNNYGCPESCAQSQFGCCPDGKTAARGAHKEGCPCQYTRFGCCPDGETTALGPGNEGCDDCRYAKHGCCPDGETRAFGPDYAGCPTTTAAPFLIGGTVAPEKIISCSLPQDQGTVCHPGYKLVWYYDVAEGRCTQFWYGGCAGNDNRFATREQCETICVEPPAMGRCFLPKIEGPLRCNQLSARYWYDYTTKQCGAFWWRGCLGNANNFESWEECQNFCSGIGPIERKTPVLQPEYTHHGTSEEVMEESSTSAEHVPSSDRPAILSADQEPPSPLPQISQPEQIQVPPVYSPSQQPSPRRFPQHPPTIEEICRSTADSGPCGNYADMFYYDAFSGKCHPFIYGGCGGNWNKFSSREECEARCSHIGADRNAPHPVSGSPLERNPLVPVALPGSGSVASTTGRSRDACLERMDVGRCQGSFESYYFERATGTCEQFRYSGCGGNANRFHTKEQCEELCVQSVSRTSVPYPSTVPTELPYSSQISGSHTSEPISVCEEPRETGPCDRFVTKWYYNKEDGTCTRFHYGGCEGTNNRFDSEQQCKNACGNYADPCTLPRVVGPCSGRHRRYYYDSETGKCERFEYGGCLGNTNNFLDLDDCVAKCSSSEENSVLADEESWNTKRCSLPKDIGPCRTAVEQYYYDTASSMCQRFLYGGCGGNENRFNTIHECLGNCSTETHFEDPGTSEVSFARHHRLQNDVGEYVYGEKNLYAHDSNYLIDDFEKFTTEITIVSTTSTTTSFPTTTTIITTTSTTITATNTSTIAVEATASFENIARNLPTDADDEALDHSSEHGGDVSDDSGDDGDDDDDDDDDGDSDTPHGFEPSSIPELCLLPEDAGPCYGQILRWRFNSETNRCETFMYTGCGHNANYFTSEEACQRACGEYRNSDVCVMNVDRGTCELGITKWYYNMDAGECHVFMYTGCGGNGNRFSSKAECQHLCTSEIRFYSESQDKDICLLERESGPCADPVTQWYFDAHSRQCMQFTYGGCRGNENRFNSKELCEQRCLMSNETKAMISRTAASCLLPFEAGPCDDTQRLWYFDKSLGYCRLFVYGGCGGNGNRFFSEVDCMNHCAIYVSKNHAETVRPELILIGYNPAPIGSAVRLNCKAYGQLPIRWHKNGVQLELSKRDDRIYLSPDHSEIHITSTHQSDAAEYSCSVGKAAILSNSIDFQIKEAEMTDECVDKGNEITCRLVIKAGLCPNPRYGNFCCRTCTIYRISRKFS